MRFLFFLIKYLADIISLLVPNITMFKLELASNNELNTEENIVNSKDAEEVINETISQVVS